MMQARGPQQDRKRGRRPEVAPALRRALFAGMALRDQRGATVVELPTVEELATQLETVSGAESIDPDASLRQNSDLDSLDLMEWLYNFQSQYPDIPADETLFADMDDTTTLRDVYQKLLALVPEQAATS
jgi:acyl carrier protein